MNAHPLTRIATSSTPEELNEACLQFYLADRGIPQDCPWLLIHLSDKKGFRHFRLGFDYEGSPGWPDCSVTGWSTRHPFTAQPNGGLYLAWMPNGSGFSTEIAWAAAVLSGNATILSKGGWGSSALVIRPTTGPSKTAVMSPRVILTELQVAAQTNRFDQMQMLAIRAAGPVVIPGFPKFYYELMPEAPLPRLEVKGRKVL